MSGGFIMDQIFTEYVFVSDAVAYVVIKAVDQKTAIKWKEMGGYLLMGVLGRALIAYANTNGYFADMKGFDCQLQPLVCGAMAAIGDFATNMYTGGNFNVFVNGTVIYLISDVVRLKYQMTGGVATEASKGPPYNTNTGVYMGSAARVSAPSKNK